MSMPAEAAAAVSTRATARVRKYGPWRPQLECSGGCETRSCTRSSLWPPNSNAPPSWVPEQDRHSGSSIAAAPTALRTSPPRQPGRVQLVPEGAIGAGLVPRDIGVSSGERDGHDRETDSYRVPSTLDIAPRDALPASARERLRGCLRGDLPSDRVVMERLGSARHCPSYVSECCAKFKHSGGPSSALHFTGVPR